MSEYYHHDLARWEGEGGFDGELETPMDHSPHIHKSVRYWNNSRHRTVGPHPRARGPSSCVRLRRHQQSGLIRRDRD